MRKYAFPHTAVKSDQLADIKESNLSDAVLELTADQSQRVVTDIKASLSGEHPLTIALALTPGDATPMNQRHGTIP